MPNRNEKDYSALPELGEICEELTPEELTPEELTPLPGRLEEREPLPGTVVPQMIQCSKPRCRCASGALHGPYFYRVWREGQKVRKVYVRKEDVARVREQTRLYLELEQDLRRVAKKREKIVKSIAREWKRLAKMQPRVLVKSARQPEIILTCRITE